MVGRRAQPFRQRHAPIGDLPRRCLSANAILLEVVTCGLQWRASPGMDGSGTSDPAEPLYPEVKVRSFSPKIQAGARTRLRIPRARLPTALSSRRRRGSEAHGAPPRPRGRPRRRAGRGRDQSNGPRPADASSSVHLQPREPPATAAGRSGRERPTR